VLTRGELVVDSEAAFTADGEVGTEGMTLASDLDDQELGMRRLSDGAAGLLAESGLKRVLFCTGVVKSGHEILIEW
jgi:hypothetical protein